MKRFSKNIGVYLLILGLVLAMAYFYNKAPGQGVKDVAFSEFTKMVSQEKFEKINIDQMKISGTTKNNEKYETYASSSLEIQWLNTQYLYKQVKDKKVKLSNEPPHETPWYVSMLPTLIMIIVLVVFWFMVMNQQGGGGKAMQFGKSRAKLQKDSDLRKVTFNDVAGLDEEKAELEEIVDFLKHPQKYNNLGARIPKGILLVGPPGTGKTYVSKATAGEAGVPFFTISGSEFVEMFVGVGASRVRDLFNEAKKNAPCIVFIDEIDAVGRKRGAGLGGGHDEREQTLNQLLVEMDGFGENSGIIVLAATNRPDVLDSALLRPGRFDRQIVIGIPDVRGREEIFKVHSGNKPLDEGVEPKVLARRTPGFTPADIENMLNEAALLTARRNGKHIRMDEIEEAITKVIAGPEKKSRVISEKERRLTAVHEAGHAIVANALPGTDPVHQITIVPRGRAGGFTMILPKEDKTYGTKAGMREQIIHLLGGRVAEALNLDDISTGASNDIQRATDIARDMVTKYGFSEKLGPVNYSSGDEVFLGKDLTSKQNYSEEIAKEIDEEIKLIIEDAYLECEKILTENSKELNTVAEALLEVETLDGKQFMQLINGEFTAKELAENVAEMEKSIAEKNRQEAEEMTKKMDEEQFYADMIKLSKNEDGSLEFDFENISGKDDKPADNIRVGDSVSKKADSSVESNEGETEKSKTETDKSDESQSKVRPEEGDLEKDQDESKEND